MGKKISIVIPYYTETEEDIFPLLSSISNQVGISFDRIECILINDGNNNVFSTEFLSLFRRINIRCIIIEENKGPGVARQAGIDNAEGEYIMFCDADDILHNVGVLGAFMQEIEQYHPDIITTLWLEEILNSDTGSCVYLTHEDDATWMHGKTFRRIFLQSKNIRFHEKLRAHEDSYFLALAFAATENRRKIPVTTYVWKYHDASITRRNGALYTYESIPEFIKAIGLTFEIFNKNYYNEMRYKVIQFIIYNYFTLHQPHWLAQERENYLKQAEQKFAEMIRKYMRHYTDAEPEYVQMIYNQERVKLFSNQIETETLSRWLSRIELKKTH